MDCARPWRRARLARFLGSRRSTALATALATALVVGLSVVGACSERAERQPAATQPVSPPEPTTAAAERAVFALAYQPTSDQGGPDGPVVRAQAAVRAKPDQAAGYVALAKAFLQRMRETGDLELMAYAKDAVNGALAIESDHREARQVQVMVLFDGHRFAEAAASARGLLKDDPDDATAHILLSDALLEMGDYEGSVAALQEAMDRYPDLRVHARTAYLRWLHGDVEGARESYGDAMDYGRRQSEPLAWCHVEMGVVDWHAGRLDRADAAATRALGLVPDYLPALTLQARLAAARGQWQPAIANLERVVARRPNAEELLLLAEWHQRAQQPQPSQEYLARAEKLAKHDPVTVALHYARHRMHKDKALALAERAAAQRPTVYAHAAHALALARAGRVDQALAASDKALALETPDARLYWQRAVIQAVAGRLDEAARTRARALALNAAADPVLAAELEDALKAAPVPEK